MAFKGCQLDVKYFNWVYLYGECRKCYTKIHQPVYYADNVIKFVLSITFTCFSINRTIICKTLFFRHSRRASKSPEVGCFFFWKSVGNRSLTQYCLQLKDRSFSHLKVILIVVHRSAAIIAAIFRFLNNHLEFFVFFFLILFSLLWKQQKLHDITLLLSLSSS